MAQYEDIPVSREIRLATQTSQNLLDQSQKVLDELKDNQARLNNLIEKLANFLQEGDGK